MGYAGDMKKKILVVTGTRAEYGLLRSTMDAIENHPALELKLLVTGMHTLQMYGNTQEEIKKDGYAIDCVVPLAEDADQLQALAQEISGIREYCHKNRPDCVLVLGDRDEPFAAVIVAAHMNIPIAHIHGGDVTGPSVDEGIRHAITKFAHVHFPGTHVSAERLRKMAEEPSRIFEVGSVVVDITQTAYFLSRKEFGEKLNFDPKRAWLTVLQHPTPFDETPLQDQIRATSKALDEFPEHEKIVLYPNSDAGSDVFISAIQKLNGPRYHVFKSLPRSEYMSIVKESEALIGNSSAGIIETAFLGTPTVDIGNRQKGRERGESVITVPYESDKIVEAVNNAAHLKKRSGGKPYKSPYGNAGAGVRIADILTKELQRPDILLKKFIG
jgi:GDP/UDP-N,N'-diacetylbacillosamine 2-epimerase (hydrolysing)